METLTISSNTVVDSLQTVDIMAQAAISLHVLRLIVIILVSGAAGGMVNYLFDKYPGNKPTDDAEKTELMKAWQYIFIGISAAFVVPVVLLSTQSSLLTTSGKDAMDYFFIAGFCIAASISARAFLNSANAKLKVQLERSRRILNDIEEENRENRELFKQDVEPDEGPLVREFIDLDEKDKFILNLLNRNIFKFGSISSLSIQSKLNTDELHGILNKLIQEGYAAQRDFEGKTRFYITTLGKLLIGQK